MFCSHYYDKDVEKNDERLFWGINDLNIDTYVKVHREEKTGRQMFWIEKTVVKSQSYKTSSEKTVAWYMRQGVTDHELQGTGILCWGGLYPVCVGKTVDILNRPVTRSSVILNKSFHPNLDNRFYLGKTAGKETN